jgi:hypothetical protein
MSGAIPPLLNTPSWHGAQLNHRDNFAFTFSFTFTGCFSCCRHICFVYLLLALVNVVWRHLCEQHSVLQQLDGTCILLCNPETGSWDWTLLLQDS